ncbi:MAG: AAC(3) family N-acetyltransferase [Nitrosomonas sp.]|nr:AAC(3) family N-acetyltransferase [Nitrosomonas sp.]MCW5608827.1 AAC(3) family N-acetyltransferase [Nitrosomonas sp.]
MNWLHSVSKTAKRFLPDNAFLKVRNGYYALRKASTPALKIIYGTFDTTALRRHLEETLDPDFEILMVHSSVNHMLPYYTGNPLELVRMLIDFCGPHRTLVMPAFFFGDPKIGSVIDTFKASPFCDLKKTPSQMGLATELFRRTKGVIQSRHPVYRVSALGPLAKALTEGHENAFGPAGRGSPFEYMAARNTLIIGIGKSFDVMTQTHHVEGIMGDVFPIPRKADAENMVVTVIDGQEKVPVTLRGSGIQGYFNIAKLPQLLDKEDLKLWKFHNVPFFAAKAYTVTTKLIAAAKQGKTLYDPF